MARGGEDGLKKILIVNNNLSVGGVQTSLVSLLNEIRREYDVTLLLFRADEQDRARVPQGVRLLTVRSPLRHLGMSAKQTKGKPFLFLARAFWAVLTRLFDHHVTFSWMLAQTKRIGRYDCAISYLHEASPKIFYGGCNAFVLDRVDAPHKIAWLHGDFSHCGADHAKSRRLYERFDCIVACSEGTKDAFLCRMPHLASRTVVVRNCNDYDLIRRLAEPMIRQDGEDAFHIITVARLSEEKGIDRALYAVRRCLDQGHRVHYHIVGDGKERCALEALCAELELSEAVTFYGECRNPYPYLKGADLLFLTSYHEAAPMVIDEAACLGVPVLSTRTTSVDEMILSCRGGWVADNNQEAISRMLCHILTHREEYLSVRQALRERVFNNTASMVAFRSAVNG